ncbi:hypothetical protein [Candidatus Mycolicibacterium alkanivorans]|uniref:DUF222 domain-containing protein n=1 Tax=Candidatus Mycolicibacterium alkanivorans TaxID=2954114 RepID=A0ABS9YW24_9MYCO|nr:hypothetical protein [Candidatus Mycolicibacterium alkanivorans]MCI4675405.1 hypothetical protein [Candidatus Mycolicibacterium alkanivorans]
MTGPHSEIGPELRALAQAILDRLDPAVRAAAAMASGAGSGPGKCQQAWCPVCALAALVNGEQHPLLTVIAQHSVALLMLVRSMAGDNTSQSGSDGPPAPDDDGPDSPPPTQGRYQRIPITVEE